MTGFWVAIDWTGLPFAIAAAAEYAEADFRADIRGGGFRIEHWGHDRAADMSAGLREWCSVDRELADVAAGLDEGAELARRFNMPTLAIHALATERARSRRGGGK